MTEAAKSAGVRILHPHEVGRPEQALLRSAIRVRSNAQAPYSGFQVGAAVRSRRTGKTYVGCNVERCSYTQTTHAEQNAIDSLVAGEGPSAIDGIAVVAAAAGVPLRFGVAAAGAASGDARTVGPCGHCLQIIWENCGGDPDVSLYLLRPDGMVAVLAMGDALPFPFGPAVLGIDPVAR